MRPVTPRAVAAEQQAQRAKQMSQKDVRDANLNMVTTAIETVRRETEILESNYANALSNQDYVGAAKIQTQMSTNAARLVQLETGKEAMEAEAKQPVKEIPRATDPVEALASQLSPASAAWVRAHPEFARDPRLTNRMIAAHNLAISGDLIPLKADSPEYFRACRKSTLGLRKRRPGSAR